tara:strand:+ start:2512 stop:2991 length:480 start_codon:yes stop_codon:yes gene_type:complete
MKFNIKNVRLKRLIKIFGGLILLNLIYLNIILPVTVSVQQIYLIAESVVIISHQRNIDLKDISQKQFDEICDLVIDRVIKVFQSNGFRLVPHALASTSGSELIILSSGAASSSFGQMVPKPIDPQTSVILSRGYSLRKTVIENWQRLVEIANDIAHAPT